MKPILQWAGGKRQLLYEIVRRMPRAYNRYYEPFLGGGAVLFALAPTARALYNDFRIETVSAVRAICADGKKRGRAPREIIVTNYAPPTLLEQEER